MKATKLEYLRHYRPKGSCGTGYSEPDFYDLHLDDGTTVEVWFDIWYRVYNEDDAKKVFENDWAMNVTENPVLADVENGDCVRDMFIAVLKERGILKKE